MQLYHQSDREGSKSFMKLSSIIMCLMVVLGIQGQQDKHISITKKKSVEDYVHRAADFFAKKKTHDAIADFKANAQWKQAHTVLFIIDEHDVLWFVQDEFYLTWTQLKDVFTIKDEPLLKIMRESGDGGWVAFLWNQNLVHSYVMNVAKGKSSFIIGAMLFEQNVPIRVQEEVFRARNFFLKLGLDETREQINNPAGRFVYGAISVELYDSAGVCLADSFDNNRVGLETADFKDDDGTFIFNSFIDATEEKPGYQWVDHRINDIPQRTFVLRVTPADSSKFFILASTYFPKVNDQYVIDRVDEAATFLKEEGTSKAFAEFSKPQGDFYKARLAVVVYDTKGIVKAHAKFPSLVGMNAYDRRDQGGYPMTKNIIDLVLKDGSGWVFQYIANAAQMVYGKYVEMPEGTYIVTVQGYTPISPRVISAGLAERISRTILTLPAPHVFHQINFGGSLWSRGYAGVQETVSYGDLFIEVYDKDGLCVSAGRDHSKMWMPLDPGFLSATRVLIKKGTTGAWMKDKHEDLNRFYYGKRCIKSPLEEYTIFVGFTEYSRAQSFK